MIRTICNSITESLPMAGGTTGAALTAPMLVSQITTKTIDLNTVLMYVGFTVLGAVLGWFVRVALNCLEQLIRRSINRKREEETRLKKK